MSSTICVGGEPHEREIADHLHDRADELVAGMDTTERVGWLRKQGFTDVQILDALLDADDPEPDEFTRDHAHGIAATFANNPGPAADMPHWMR